MMVNVEMASLPNEMLCEIAQSANELQEEALTIILKRNENLIYKIAHSLEAKGYTSHLFDFDDLCQTGRMAMMEAVRRFDPDKDNKFSTYCWVYVSGIMRNEATANSSLVSASRETISRARNKEGDVEREIYRNTFEPLSLNAYSVDNEKEELINRVRTSEDTTRIYMNRGVTRDILKDVARHLTDRERFVIFEYFGIGDNRTPQTEENIAGKLGLTRQRVQQLKKSGIRKMADRLRADGYEIADFLS